MSKKFFSLIHGEKVHVAPETKIVPGESISTILDAQEVLKLVKSDSEQFKMEVAGHCEKLKEQAQREGFEQGYSEWIEKIADLEAEIKKVRTETEGVIIPIALKAAKKIVGRELDVSESTVVDIIKNSLKAVATHKKIKIYVNKKELDLMERHKEQLKEVFENLEALSILSQEEIEPAGCIIETEGGIINAQLENQWMILENAFQKLISPPKIDPHHGEAPQEEEAKQEEPQPIEEAKEEVQEEEEEREEAVEDEEEDEEDDEWEDEDDDEWEDEEEEEKS